MIAEGATFSGEARVLQRLTALLMDPLPSMDWTELAPGDQGALQATYALIELDTWKGRQNQITQLLERLLYQLAHTTERRQADYQGFVQGRVLWSATYKARYADNYDPTRFVCREVHHRYVTLENEVLKYVVDHFNTCLQAVPPAFRAGAWYFPASAGDYPHPLSAGGQFGRIEAALIRLRRDTRLRNVTVPDSLSSAHQLAAQRTRITEYERLLGMYERLAELVVAPPVDWWMRLAPIARRVLAVPGWLEDDGERWLRWSLALARWPKEEQTGS